MGAETIKDLVVRIGLETDPSSAKKSIEDLSKTVDTASKKMVASHKRHGTEVSAMAKQMAKPTVGAQKWAVGIGKIDKANKAAAKSTHNAVLGPVAPGPHRAPSEPVCLRVSECGPASSKPSGGPVDARASV